MELTCITDNMKEKLLKIENLAVEWQEGGPYGEAADKLSLQLSQKIYDIINPKSNG